MRFPVGHTIERRAVICAQLSQTLSSGNTNDTGKWITLYSEGLISNDVRLWTYRVASNGTKLCLLRAMKRYGEVEV
jgi:hypothetical protein